MSKYNFWDLPLDLLLMLGLFGLVLLGILFVGRKSRSSSKSRRLK